jgi:hypothetical protein
MTWVKAFAVGLLIVVYFVVATVWLPDFVLQLDPVANAASWVQDALIPSIWGVGLAAGLIGLRIAQRKGWFSWD